jgi:hypothetical protein
LQYTNLMMPDIPLQNGKTAFYLRSYKSIVPDIDPHNPIDVHEYHAPCPLCETPTLVKSINGWSFITHQVACLNCGIYFRPIQKH